MTPERWAHVEQVLLEALELPPAERTAFLDEACSGDPLLRSEVESLLSADQSAGGFIEQPAVRIGDSHAQPEPQFDGSRRLGPYIVTGRLGQGGMGEVYLAEDPRLGRKLALKILPVRFTMDEGRVKRFQQEARAASALNHPNIITVYDIGQTGPSFFIATELVDGQTLRQWMAESRPGIDALLDVSIQVAGALSAAHNAGIVHRDIKPENIMIRPDGYVKVLDFGLAKLNELQANTTDSQAPTIAEVHTDPGTVMGTAKYMSPEQARGLAVDSRTDIFSLGVVIYETIAGQVPFDGATAADVIGAILFKEPLPIASYAENIPLELKQIVEKALQKEPGERHQSALAMLEELKSLRKRLDFQAEQSRISSSGGALLQGAANIVLTPSAGAGSTVPGSPVSSRQSLGERIGRHRTLALGAMGLVAAAAALILFAILKPDTAAVEIPIEQFVLSNGLHVELSEDHSAPTVSVSVTYRVGSVDEPPGRTGFAHLFEHLMFAGSANVGKGEHSILVSNNGGQMNAQAMPDNTVYYETLPSNQLDLGLFLEADRMRSLLIDQPRLDNHRRTVKEERRLRIDNQPYGRTQEALLETAYTTFGYNHLALGSIQDLDAATVEDVKNFFDTYYAPNNAILALVGDFNSEEAKAKVKRYFEDIPARHTRPPQPVLDEPESTGERRRTVEDPFARNPRLDFIYKIPGGGSDDWHAMNLLSRALAEGQSSRLYQTLVKEKEVAASVTTQIMDVRGPALVSFAVVARPGKDLALIERLALEEIERTISEPLAAWELEKVRVQSKRQLVRQLQSSGMRSILLGKFAADHGRPELVNTLWKRTSGISAEQISRAAHKYLDSRNRIVLTTVPGSTDSTARSSKPAALESSPQESLSQVERKNLAPVSSEILRAKIPPVTEAVLENGLNVMIVEDHRLPIVTVVFSVAGAGPLYEPAEASGLATVTAQMLQEGTQRFTSRQIAEELEKRGASVMALTQPGSSATQVSAWGLSDTFEQWFVPVSDLLLNPTFPSDELNALKQRQIAQLQAAQSSPQFIAYRVLSRVLFGQHPAAVISPTIESINAMTPERLARWHRERYTPQNTILGIAGDVRPDELVPKLKKLLNGWQRTESKLEMPPSPSPAAATTVHLVDRPGSVQSTIYVGNIAVDRRDQDYLPMVVLNKLLGDGPGARLVLKLREEKGYAFNVSSQFVATRYPGPWVAFADVRAPVTGPALADLLNEIRRIGEQRVPQSELDEQERAVSASFALSLEEPSQLLSYALVRKTYGFSSDYWDTYPAKIMGVSADDIQRVARRYLSPDRLQVVVVGDAGMIRSALSGYKSLEVVDEKGSPLAHPSP